MKNKPTKTNFQSALSMPWHVRKGQLKMSRLALSLAMILVTAACVSAQNVVVQWNAIASTTIVTNHAEASVASGVWFAYVHLAVYDAVNAIDRRFQPYLFTTDPPTGANKDAAAVAAAHRVLVHYFPSDQGSLDAQYVSSLAAIPDTQANISAGVTVGEASAQAMIAARANDGLLASVPYTPPVGPGFWLPTPPAYAPIPLTPWLGQMVPFTMASAAEFLPHEGPPCTKQPAMDRRLQPGKDSRGDQQHRSDATTDRDWPVLDGAHRQAVRTSFPDFSYSERARHLGHGTID